MAGAGYDRFLFGIGFLLRWRDVARMGTDYCFDNKIFFRMPSTMAVETTGSFEMMMSVYQTTYHYIPKERNHLSHCL
jgi:hypothetical protein